MAVRTAQRVAAHRYKFTLPRRSMRRYNRAQGAAHAPALV
jgi:hypothetical protein